MTLIERELREDVERTAEALSRAKRAADETKANHTRALGVETEADSGPGH
jgi:hypothetical protein